jgi:DNA-binding NarL/FixJ family response regulator
MPSVLLADDSKLVRETLRSLLVEEGFDVCADAPDGEQAVEMAKKLRPDVVVLDYRMPGMSGVQAAYAIRQFAPNTKIIFCSVDDTSEIAAAARVMGGDAFVSKSAPVEILLAVRHLIAGENVIGAKIVP